MSSQKTASNLDILNEIKNDAIIYSACSENKRLSKYIQLAKSKHLNSDKRENKEANRLTDHDVLINLPTIQRKFSLFGRRYHLVDDPVSFSTYFANWIFFLSMNFVNNGLTTSAISSILSDRVKTYGESNACDMLDKLWADRWIVNSKECSQIRFNITKNNIDQHRLTFPEIIESYLDHARQKSSSLDEWFESLYKLMPLAQYGYLIYEKDKSEDGKKFHRFYDEMAADIFGVMGYCLYEGVMKGNDEALTNEYLNFEDKVENNNLSIRHALSYHLHARVTYPKFWFENAYNFLVSGKKIRPPELNAFDHHKLTSAMIMISPEFSEIACEAGINGSISIDRYPSLKRLGKNIYFGNS